MKYKKFRNIKQNEFLVEYLYKLVNHMESQISNLFDRISCISCIDELKSPKENNITQVCQQLINKFGAEHQIVIAIEELSELQKELCKILRGEADGVALMEEIADVEIVLEQVKLILKNRKDVNFLIDKKLQRAKERYLND